MTTATAQPLAPLVAAGRYDRLFYGGIGVAMAATVLIGFGQNYYFAFFSDQPLMTNNDAPVTRLVHAHGVLFGAWVLLFVAQTSLVSQRKVQLHRRLGIAGGVLAASMVVVGTMTALASAARGGGRPDPLSFLIVPLTDMVMFGTFVGLALRMRTNREAHKRLMLLAYTSILAAAIGRTAIASLGPPVVLLVSLSCVAAGIVYDLATRRRVHPAYLWGGGALLASGPLRIFISQTTAWKAFAGALVGLV